MEPQPAVDVQQLLQANNAQLLRSLNTLVTEKIGSLKDELQESQSRASQVQLAELKKVKYGGVPTFKRKANEDQWKHNLKVSDVLEEARSSLQLAKFDTVNEKISEGIDLVDTRQKLVLLADTSEYGWATAQEYIGHELAGDSDDEKRIWKAEMRAGKKSKEKALKAKKFKGRKFQPFNEAGPMVSKGPQSAVTRKSGGYGSRQGPCFACGRLGHYRFECRATPATVVQQPPVQGGISGGN